MLTGTAPRRITAAITPILLAMLVVALGGSARAAAPQHRLTIGSSHQLTATLQASTVTEDATQDHQAPPQLDLTAILPPAVDDVAGASAPETSTEPLERAGTADLTPIGRAPPER